MKSIDISRSSVPSVVILTVLALWAAWFGYYSVWTFDNILYRYSFDTGLPIASLADIVPSQIAHLSKMNGRFLAHAICQAILSFTCPGFFALCTALANVYLVVITCRLIGVGMRQWRYVAALALLLMVMVPGMTPVHQVGYVWMTALILTFVYVFLHKDYPARYAPLLLVLSILVGNAHEGLNIGVGAALLIYVARHLRSLSAARWCMFVGFGIGGLVLCLAPGVVERAGENHVPLPYTLMMLATVALPLLAFVALLGWQLWRCQTTLAAFYRGNAFLVNAMGVLVVFNLVIGIGGRAQLFGVNYLSVILIFRLLRGRSFSPVWLVLLAAVAVGATMRGARVVATDRDTYQEWTQKLATRQTDTIYVTTTGVAFDHYLDTYLKKLLFDECGYMYGPLPEVRVYPEAFREVRQAGLDYAVREVRPGDFMVVRRRGVPVSFVVRRSLDVPFVNIPVKPYQVDFGLDPTYDTSDYEVAFITTSLPMVRNVAVDVVN